MHPTLAAYLDPDRPRSFGRGGAGNIRMFEPLSLLFGCGGLWLESLN